jgi:DNA polymerase V
MSIFALVDCNNFYASCERVFSPKLKGKPIVILSNNDGCVIARSNEAKALGIPMGAPYFKYKKICTDNEIAVFSSNYQLYGDMSGRVMTSLKELAPELEIYSVDEAFLKLDDLSNNDLNAYALSIKQKIGQWTGIPVSIGIGPTKTLAKLANFMAKKSNSGVFDIRDGATCQAVLKDLKVGEVWGVGKNIATRLNSLGIITAAELKAQDPKYIRKIFGVVGERIVLELRGTACFSLNTNPDPKQTIITSRSFSKPVTDLVELEEAISDYAARACEKMRAQNSKARGINVFIQTNPHKDQEEFYQNSLNFFFDEATDDTRLVIKAAKELVSGLYREGLRYKKVGITLLDLNNDQLPSQTNLFSAAGNKASNVVDAKRQKTLMKVMDDLNEKMGRGTILLAAQGIEQEWSMKRGLKSSNYTTNWDDLPRV